FYMHFYIYSLSLILFFNMLSVIVYISSTISVLFFFFFNDPATTEIYTLSLHDALPISSCDTASGLSRSRNITCSLGGCFLSYVRSEEHTSELQSRGHLVCRLLLEKKKIRQVRALTRSGSYGAYRDHRNSTGLVPKVISL